MSFDTWWEVTALAVATLAAAVIGAHLLVALIGRFIDLTTEPHDFDLNDGWCHIHRDFCSMSVSQRRSRL